MRSKFFAILGFVITSAFLSSAAIQQSAEQLYQSGLYAEEVAGDLQKAIGIFELILKQFPDNKETAARVNCTSGCATKNWGWRKLKKLTRRLLIIIQRKQKSWEWRGKSSGIFQGRSQL